MATSRPFAYNTGSTLPYTEQVGDIAVGTGNIEYANNYGGLKWWGGPDEDLGYVITHTVVGGNQPNPLGISAYLGFWRSPLKTEQSFVDMTNYFFNQSFTTGNQCKTYLNNNGYWTSWGTNLVTSGLTLSLDAGDSASYSGAGSTWYDLTANQNNATLFNSPTYNPSGYLNFNKNSLEYSTVPNIGSLPKWTIEVWVRFSSSLSGQIASVLTNQYNGATSLNYSIGTNNAPSSYNIAAGFFDGAWRNTTGFAPSLNTWYQIVGTYDGSVIRQYVNGSASGGTLNYVGTPSSGGQIRMMTRWDTMVGSGNYIDGDLSIARIYNRDLSSTEVLQNFNVYKSRFSL